MVAMDEADVRDLIDRAFDALREGDYVRALAVGDQLVAARPQHAVARAIRAQALLGADSPEESFGEAARSVELAAEDEHAHLLLALTAWRTGRMALAQESFQRAIACSGGRASALGEYAWFMANERGPKLAEEAAREAVEADAGSSTAWAALGLAQFRLHRRREAEASLRRALQLNPSDIYAQSAMLALLQDRGDNRRAEALAGLLQEHAGTEDLVASVRDEAKQRQIARMLMERKVDIEHLVSEPRRYGWIWVAAGGVVVALLSYFADPWAPAIVVLLTLFLLVALRRWFD
jgi:tetratricopeptide (TPR) repeat protein